MAVAKVKLPLALMKALSPPLFRNTRPVPVRPETVPPMVKVTPETGGVVPGIVCVPGAIKTISALLTPPVATPERLPTAPAIVLALAKLTLLLFTNVTSATISSIVRFKEI